MKRVLVMNVIDLDYNLSDDEELSYVYFNLDDFKYFTIAINKEEDELPYLELNEQIYATQSKDFDFKYDGHSIEFVFSTEIQNALHIDGNLLLNLEQIEKSSIQEVIEILDYILS